LLSTYDPFKLDIYLEKMAIMIDKNLLAITTVSRRPVKEAWIFLPTAAGALRVL
jgi:hypothetical protein